MITWRTVLEGLKQRSDWEPPLLVQCPPYTMVRVSIELDGEEHVGVGFAKCSPRDTWDAALGERIARGRALKQLALSVTPESALAIAIAGVAQEFSRAVATWAQSIQT